MKRGCHYLDENGVQCGRAAQKHGIILSGPTDDPPIAHPVLAGSGWTTENAARISERWRFVREYGSDALNLRDIAERNRP